MGLIQSLLLKLIIIVLIINNKTFFEFSLRDIIWKLSLPFWPIGRISAAPAPWRTLYR